MRGEDGEGRACPLLVLPLLRLCFYCPFPCLPVQPYPFNKVHLKARPPCTEDCRYEHCSLGASIICRCVAAVEENLLCTKGARQVRELPIRALVDY